MNVLNIVGKMKEKFHSARDKLALAILIWLEKEPSQERVLSAAAAGDNNGPYIRYRDTLQAANWPSRARAPERKPKGSVNAGFAFTHIPSQ